MAAAMWHHDVVNVITKEFDLQWQTDNSPRIVQCTTNQHTDKLQCISLLCQQLVAKGPIEIVTISPSRTRKRQLVEQIRMHFPGTITQANPDVTRLENGSIIAHMYERDVTLQGIGARILIWDHAFAFTEPNTANIISSIILPMLEVDGTMIIGFRDESETTEWIPDVSRTIWDLYEVEVEYADANEKRRRLPIKMLKYATIQYTK